MAYGPAVDALVTLDAALIGLLVGAVLAAASWRLPRGINVLGGRSRCPACGSVLRWSDIVPVVSWLALRGRCRACDVAISIRYPVVETCCGAAGGLIGAGLVGSWIAALVVLVAGVLLLWAVARSASRRACNRSSPAPSTTSDARITGNNTRITGGAATGGQRRPPGASASDPHTSVQSAPAARNGPKGSRARQLPVTSRRTA